VVWRGESGKSYAADAYCPHLGAHLGVGGKVSGECIKCPFHGWSFHGEDGKLTNIPYSESGTDIFVISCKLCCYQIQLARHHRKHDIYVLVMNFAQIKMWRTLEMNGFIYLWYHAEGSEPHWFPERHPEIESGAWKYRGRTEFQVGCHIQDIPENGADAAHLNIVHDVAMMAGGEPDFSWTKWDFIKHVWTGKWGVSGKPGEEHIAIANLEHKIFLVNKIPLLFMDVVVKQVRCHF